MTTRPRRAHPRGALLAALLVLPAALAAGAEREVGGTLESSVNPLGLQLRTHIGWKWGLYDSSRALLRDAHVAVGLAPALSPAHGRAEAWIQLAPLSILELRAAAGGVGYFGTFGHLVGLPSYGSDFSDDARERIEDQAEAAVGAVFTLAPTFRIAFGRLGLQSSASFEWWEVDAPREFFYEPFRATLLDADGDSLVVLSSVAAFDLSRDGSRSRQLGLYHDLVHVWDAPGGNRRERLGPFVSWRIGQRRFGLADPTLAAGVLVYLEAPNRDGAAAFLALSFELR